MKTLLFYFFVVALAITSNSQTIPFNYNLKLKPVIVSGLPGLHSFAFAQSGGKWLVIGGRKDGLHARQPFNAFLETNNNSTIYVIDIVNNQFWTASVNTLTNGLKEQLQSTNMNFYQDKDSLYIIGGYGYSPSSLDHITYPNLTSISVNGLISSIVNGTSIAPHFKQITDSRFAVNGGHLGKIGASFYLIGGHKFDGRYNPMGMATYTQTYADGLSKFMISNFGSTLSISNYTKTIDMVHLHRRDYNLLPQIFPSGEVGYTISSGVFQIGVDLPFLYPVDIKASGHLPITGFNQYLSNYHSANISAYDSINNTMHSIFFGGMSQYSYIGNVLTQDNNVPFVKTISRVSRNGSGTLQENIFPIEMPSLIGASAEFIPNHSIPHYDSEIIKLSQITGDSVLIGHILGGIYSSQSNPFTSNTTNATNAHNTIYEVWILKSQPTSIKPLDGTNPLVISVFPNPTKSQINIEFNIPSDGDMDLQVTDIKGKIVWSKQLFGLVKGNQTIPISNNLNLTNGLYSFNFTFNGKYSIVKKVQLTD
jgi:hypothetical protein